MADESIKDVASLVYRTGNDLDLDVVIELYRDSTLGLRRPIDDRPRMKQMIEGANLIITAWTNDELIGIARSLTDFAYSTYLADMAVRLSWQRRGVGRELIKRTQEAGGEASVFLFAAPAAVDYYPRIGMSAGSGWMLKSNEQLK